MSIANEFEVHLTVDAADAAGVAALRAWAGVHGLKFTHIVLAQGLAASQPMVTRWQAGELTEVQASAKVIAAELRREGWVVNRIKLEVATTAGLVPRTLEEGAAQPRDRYFEHHLKLALRTDFDANAERDLTNRVVLHGAHLSRNAIRRHVDGRQERFVTQRCHGVGVGAARERSMALQADLKHAGYSVIEIEEEFVVYDSNLAMDDGWIDGLKGWL